MMLPDSKKTFGDVPEDFKRFVAITANSIPQASRIRRYPVALIAAILVIALGCTAFAAYTLLRTPEHVAIQTARDMLTDKYGLPASSYGLYLETISENEDAWEIDFHPTEFEQQLGQYHAVIPKEKDAEASIYWSHDGISSSDSDLGASAWGKHQIERYLELKSAYNEKKKELNSTIGPELQWRIDDYAALDALMSEVPMYNNVAEVHIRPSSNDIGEEDAIRRMIQAISEEYGVTTEILEGYSYHLTFSKKPRADVPSYTLLLYDASSIKDMAITDYFRVEMSSPSGEMYGFSREEAGEQTYTVAPRGQRSTISESEKTVCEIAKATLDSAYGVTETMQSVFSINTKYDTGIWVVEFAPKEEGIWKDDYTNRLGKYEVTIDPESEMVLQTAWSNDGISRTEIDTASTLASAPAWNSTWLPVFIEFNAERLAMEANAATENADQPRTAMEGWRDEAEYQTLFREAGFDAEAYRAGIPGKENLQFEDAVNIAKTVLHEEYAVDDEAMSLLNIAPTFVVTNPERPIWEFAIFSEEEDDSYLVILDGNTGEVMRSTYFAIGNG